MERIPHCYVCGKKVIGGFYCDWHRNVACMSHLYDGKLHYCFSCNRICDMGSKELYQGNWLCSKCQTNVVTEQQCAKMAQWVKDVYSCTPIGEIGKCFLKSMTPIEMCTYSGNKNCEGLARQRGNEHTIFFYRHMSIVHFTDVLAHELLHIWQYEHNYFPEPLYCEGFCNLGSFFVLNAINNAESKNRIKILTIDPDPIYGEGFRLMKSLYDEGGWILAINKLKQNAEGIK
ncbi:MAG: hypothetical protein K5860_11035 [Bacteroidales bacterium]|nr:hypothetical protein [Bacteroidales bacterium]